jgi:hypothetical protein
LLHAKTAAALVKPLVDNYDYKPTNYLAADETYIKGVSNPRDVDPCILAMRMAFAKFKIFPGKALKLLDTV